MKITLKDGSVKEYAESKSVYEIALDISEGLARAACAGEVNGEVVDLRTTVDKDCNLNILTFIIRKIAHMCEYAILFLLIYYGLHKTIKYQYKLLISLIISISSSVIKSAATSK